MKNLLMEEVDPIPKPPFRARFHAWWNGYQLSHDGSAPDAAEGTGEDAPAQRGGSALREETRAAKKEFVEPKTPWPEPRRKLAQLVWGDGFLSPAGSKQITELVQPLGLDSAASMIEVGAGMGGSTRVIAESSGAYVTAWDLEPELAEEGTVQAGVFSLEKKASVHHLNTEKFAFKQNFYSGGLIHESLYRIDDKEALLEAVIGSLKPGAMLIVWDLFYDQDDEDPALAEWIENEKGRAHGWTVEAARAFLTGAGIDLRVTNDDTDDYCANAVSAWSRFVAEITADPLGDDLVPWTMREVERWASRIAALESGALKLYRLAGTKRDDVV